MKKLIFSLFSIGLLLTTTPLQAAIDCHVVEKSGQGQASLPWQVDRVNQGICGTVLFTLMSAPLKVTLSEPLLIEGTHSAMISGADYSSDAPWLPLGVVIDARAIEGCAIYIEKPQAFSVKALSFWVNDWDEALCDFQGRSILRKGSSAYVGDTLATSYYAQLQICEGPKQSQSCTEAPLPPLPPLQVFDKLKGPPKPPLTGPDDILSCSDGDQDGICDSVDFCNLIPSNALAGLLKAIIEKQCPTELKQTALCSQSQDADQDGYGNACDWDADEDGYSNQEEKAAGSDPLDASSIPEQEQAEPTSPLPEPDSQHSAEPQGNGLTPSKSASPGVEEMSAGGCSLEARAVGGGWSSWLLVLLGLAMSRREKRA